MVRKTFLPWWVLATGFTPILNEWSFQRSCVNQRWWPKRSMHSPRSFHDRGSEPKRPLNCTPALQLSPDGRPLEVLTPCGSFKGKHTMPYCGKPAEVGQAVFLLQATSLATPHFRTRSS